MNREDELNKAFELGHIVAREEIAEVILNRASDEFKRNKDELAQYLKRLSSEFRQDASERRQVYDSKYHSNGAKT